MTTYLGKSCSFCLAWSIYVFSYFPFGFEGRIWNLIVSVPDNCLSFYFALFRLVIVALPGFFIFSFLSKRTIFIIFANILRAIYANIFS